MTGRGSHEGNLDPGIRLILAEIRDLRVEMRADRRLADEERRQADAERRRADEERRKADAAWQQERRKADEERRKADDAWRLERRQANDRFERVLREVMRETQRAFKDVRAVGLSIVKTLNHHTRILERIERKLGTPGRWRPGQGNGRAGAA